MKKPQTELHHTYTYTSILSLKTTSTGEVMAKDNMEMNLGGNDAHSSNMERKESLVPMLFSEIHGENISQIIQEVQEIASSVATSLIDI